MRILDRSGKRMMKEELGDCNRKGFEVTISKINKPNIKPKGRRWWKSNKVMLKLATMATRQTKLLTGKGALLPQGQ